MVASNPKMNGILDQELEEELMKFTTKYEETKKPTEFYRDADVEVDIITGHVKSDGDKMVEAERVDATESSSSFDASDCGVGDFDASGETEVLSHRQVDDESASDFDAFGEFHLMRKKKLTNSWRSFIKPLRWRCKWIELQIKRLEGEAQKYDRELERYRQQKMVRLKGFTLDDLNVKSLPFSGNHVRKEVFTRKKRRRDEATEDLASYMSRHNLFSYYENSGRLTNGALADIGLKSHGQDKVDADDEFWGNDDDSILENIFRKIDFLRSRVGELKSRADKIRNENGFYGSCLNNVAPTSDDLDGLSLGDYIVSQLIAEYKLSQLIGPCPDGVRGNNARTNRIHFDPTENDDYGVLIDNPRINVHMDNFEGLIIQPIQRPVLAESNRPADDKCPPSTRSILKAATNAVSPNKRKKDGLRVRFAI
ncbi:hypothetical protein CASFOL_041196 [Castilleja foliolosa]|uniref:Uncharacterized protein n=1 Tax=Castilleja foliolosa TaxID=1961234 RepID=A0ABD3BFF7_9LAMI